MEPYWSEANGHAPHSVKFESEAAVSNFPYCTESSLNFSTSTTAYSEDDAEYATGRRNKTSRQDPLSHRIIEKRRRDRMNSCLADLSRLIPPQYQRKGRGRIEKTEIIEMAIRHLKHLQSECIQKENEYRQGYSDCMKEAAKFLYDAHMQDFCYRLLTRLQEHCDEVMKSECYKSRVCHAPDNVSASSGSPHHMYHSAPPLCQLREMLSASDIEHSNDHNDVKDLSFRNHLNQLHRTSNIEHQNGGGAVSNSTSSSSSAAMSNNATTTTSRKICSGVASSPHQPHQAPVITSTAPASLHHNTDSSNHDFESSHEPLLHTDTSNMHSPPPRDTLLHNSSHIEHHHPHTTDSMLSSGRLRNFSESSHDIEHNNNYKYKNHIKERFNHELHDEESTSDHCPAPTLLQSEHSHAHSDHSHDGTEPEIAPIIAKKRKLAEAASSLNDCCAVDNHDALTLPSRGTTVPNVLAAGLAERKEKLTSFAFSDIKTELNSNSPPNSLVPTAKAQCSPATTTVVAPPPAATTLAHTRSFAVPIFALHAQGTYYVPLNVDYNVLLPFLNGIDLLDKNYTSMPVVHPININVNFMPTMPASLLAAAATAAAVAAGKQQPTPAVLNGNGSTTTTTAAAAAAKAKLEAITNGW